MSSPMPTQNQGVYPPPPSQGCCGGSLLKGLGCGCLVVILLCCGGGGTIGYFLYFRWLSASNDPAEIQACAKEIATLDVPAALAPRASLRWNIPNLATPLLLAVMYEDSGSNSTLILASGRILEGQRSQQSREFVAMMLQQRGTIVHREELSGEEMKAEDLKVNGVTHRFEFTTGRGVNTHSKRIEVSGTFSGKQGTSLLLFSGDAEKYPAEKLQALIESIH